ncbi:MAG: cytidylate kinase-like family protein [Verrucomicrobia bacterium]|nr:cytidylate kinase-like family protein [Verrucomicrobiota bacterium]
MSVITISRGSFSGGKQLAECLARRLNYRCIDRDVVTQRTSIRTISPDELFGALETAPAAVSTLNHRRYIYLALVQAALLEELSKGNAVYHGLAGHLLLQGGLTVFRVRVIAPLDFRLREAQQRLNLSRPEALAHIRKVDDQRSKWTRYLYGVDWEDPSLYDLVVNLQHLSVEQACRLVAAMIKEGAFEFTADRQASMGDFILASRVRAALARDALTSNLEVEVAARAGTVIVRGDLCEEDEEVHRVAAAVAGVGAVRLESALPPVPSAN